MRPPPGTAAEQDVIAARHTPEKRLCELVDGVLIEKAPGFRESVLGAGIAARVGSFVHESDLGIVLGADGMVRLRPGLVRIPVVSFFSWDHFPDGKLPEDPIPDLVPELVVEVPRAGNTANEMKRKLRDYFEAGVRMAWLIESKTQTAEVYTSPTESWRVGRDQRLEGATVLPGFTLSLRELFDRLKRRRASR